MIPSPHSDRRLQKPHSAIFPSDQEDAMDEDAQDSADVAKKATGRQEGVSEGSFMLPLTTITVPYTSPTMTPVTLPTTRMLLLTAPTYLFPP
jgi:hypothetical protein